ncbi:MAG TPA: hypothetical protein VLF94_04520 [Chlamydiales bacterium]|nr:hypothetical protein [Chlamydiales bacterium]
MATGAGPTSRERLFVTIENEAAAPDSRSSPLHSLDGSSLQQRVVELPSGTPKAAAVWRRTIRLQRRSRHPEILPAVAALLSPQKGDCLSIRRDAFRQLRDREKETVKSIEIYDCPDCGSASLQALQKFKNLETLFLKNLPGVDSAMIEDLFSRGKKKWKYLRELQISDIPVSAEALRCLSLLPQLEVVTISNSARTSVNGLNSLFMNSASLKTLTVSGCPLDMFAQDFIQGRNADAKIIIKTNPDPTAVRLAAEGAGRAVKDLIQKRFCIFSQDLSDKQKQRQFYRDCLDRMGFNDAEIKELLPDLILCELVLQEYVNLSRTVNELGEGAPPSFADRFKLLGQQTFTDKVTEFRFEGTGISALPDCITSNRWPELQKIHLEETYIGDSAPLLKLMQPGCPRLKEVSIHPLIVDFSLS